MKSQILMLFLTLGSVISFDLRLYVLPFSSEAQGKNETLFIAVDGVVQSNSLIIGDEIPKNGLLPVIFEGKNGRQSELLFIPTYGPEDLEKHKDEEPVEDNHSGEIIVEDNGSNITDASDHVSTESNKEKTPKSEKKSNRLRILVESKNNRSLTTDKTKITDEEQINTDDNSVKLKDDESVDTKEDLTDSDDDETIDEAGIVLNFEFAKENANKITEARDDLKDLVSGVEAKEANFKENHADEDLDAHLIDYNKIIGLGVYEHEVKYTDLKVEPPKDGEIINVEGKDLIVVIQVEQNEALVVIPDEDNGENIISDDNSHDNTPAVDEIAADESDQKNDIDFFLSLDFNGEKKDGKAFLFTTVNEVIDNDKIEVDVDNIKTFLEAEAGTVGQILVSFVDPESKLMSKPTYVKVYNHFEEDKKDTYESVDENTISLTKEIYHEFLNEEGDHEDKTLNLYEDVTEIKVEENDKVEGYLGDAEKEIDGDKNIQNILGPNTLIQVIVKDNDETGSEERKKRMIRMLIV